MSLKAFLFLVPVAAGGWYFASGSSGSFTRDVDRTPAQVAAAIADLDIRRQPGTPGTDPAASGGVRPVFRTEQSADAVTFTVWSGNRVATRMIAHLEPLDGGRRTRIRGEVVRGDAPDEQVSPAFRSTGVTLGLFGNALNDEVNLLLSPPRRSRAECNELERRLLEANAPADGNAFRAIGVLHAVERELRNRGCDTSAHADRDQFQGAREAMKGPVSRMGPAPSAPAMSGGPATGGASFEPGRPMVDVSRSRNAR
jgi:hypothetical protein